MLNEISQREKHCVILLTCGTKKQNKVEEQEKQNRNRQKYR